MFFGKRDGINTGRNRDCHPGEVDGENLALNNNISLTKDRQMNANELNRQPTDGDSINELTVKTSSCVVGTTKKLARKKRKKTKKNGVTTEKPKVKLDSLQCIEYGNKNQKSFAKLNKGKAGGTKFTVNSNVKNTRTIPIQYMHTYGETYGDGIQNGHNDCIDPRIKILPNKSYKSEKYVINVSTNRINFVRRFLFLDI